MVHSLTCSSMALLTILPFTLAHNTTSSSYTLTSNLTYTNFFPAFTFFSGPDPTHGSVHYLNATAAASTSLVGLLPDTHSAFLGVDYTSTPSSDSPGRASVRLESVQTFNTGLLVADIRHMPASTCGVWPAFWLVGPKWPQGGEIDVLEGVNEQEGNAVTLHTGAGCVVDNSTAAGGEERGITGHMTTRDCDVNARGKPENAGCSVRARGVAGGCRGARMVGTRSGSRRMGRGSMMQGEACTLWNGPTLPSACGFSPALPRGMVLSSPQTPLPQILRPPTTQPSGTHPSPTSPAPGVTFHAASRI